MIQHSITHKITLGNGREYYSCTNPRSKKNIKFMDIDFLSNKEQEHLQELKRQGKEYDQSKYYYNEDKEKFYRVILRFFPLFFDEGYKNRRYRSALISESNRRARVKRRIKKRKKRLDKQKKLGITNG